MKYKDLIAVFILSGALNIILICCTLYLIWINTHKHSREFYRLLILFLIIVSYIWRITLFIYTVVFLPNSEYNRDWDNAQCKHTDKFKVFLVDSSYLVIPLAAWAYIWRWFGYLILSSNKAGFGAKSKINRLRLCLLWLIMASLWLLALRVFIPHIFDNFMTAYLILLYTVTPIILVVVLEIFLKRLKREWSMLYRRAKISRIYVLVIVILLFARGLSIIMDYFISKKFNNKKKSTWLTVNDIQLLAFYFLENAPSIQIIITLWRSYKGKRVKDSNNYLIPQDDTMGDNWR